MMKRASALKELNNLYDSKILTGMAEAASGICACCCCCSKDFNSSGFSHYQNPIRPVRLEFFEYQELHIALWFNVDHQMKLLICTRHYTALIPTAKNKQCSVSMAYLAFSSRAVIIVLVAFRRSVLRPITSELRSWRLRSRYRYKRLRLLLDRQVVGRLHHDHR